MMFNNRRKQNIEQLLDLIISKMNEINWETGEGFKDGEIELSDLQTSLNTYRDMLQDMQYDTEVAQVPVSEADIALINKHARYIFGDDAPDMLRKINGYYSKNHSPNASTDLVLKCSYSAGSFTLLVLNLIAAIFKNNPQQQAPQQDAAAPLLLRN